VYLEFTETEQDLRREVRDYLEERLPGDWTGITAGQPDLDFSFKLCQELAERGWLTPSWPVEFGGRDASVWESLILEEEYTGHFEPRGGQYIGTDRVGPSLMMFGTEEQKRRYLPAIGAGRAQWVQLFSERDAGSDLASLRTSARLEGDVLVVNGEKVWTSYANSATHAFLLARSDPGTSGREGISVLLLDMASPGIEVREIRSPLGWHRIHSVQLTDVRVPLDCVLGKLGDGWRITTGFLGVERSGTARYARTTRILGSLETHVDPSDSISRSQLADCLAFGRAVEAMVDAAVDMQSQGEIPRWASSVLRIANGLYEQTVADFADDLLGVMSRIAKPDEQSFQHGEVEQFVVRQAPTGTVTGGSYEIQMSIIARDLLGLGRGR
jgi:alkylation response protein AidB-like acyl-CoA dehydrogenase